MARGKASAKTHSKSKPSWILDQNTRAIEQRTNGGIGSASCGLENTWNRLENRNVRRNGSKKDKSNKKDQEKGEDKKRCLAGKRDLIHLLCILRFRVVPSVPYLDIVEIIEREWKESYMRLISSADIDAELYQKANEREKKCLVADWCMELLEHEYERCGGRWVATVNWESERVVNVIDYLGLDKKGYTLLDAEGISMLRTEIMWKKAPKWIWNQMRQAEAFLNTQRRRKLIDIMLQEGPVQQKWIEEQDFRAYSVPDLGWASEKDRDLPTPDPQPPIGSPKGLDPSDEIENRSYPAAKFDTGSVSSYIPSRRSNTSISSVTTTSSIFSHVPQRSYANTTTVEDDEMLRKKCRDCSAMRQGLERMIKMDLEDQSLIG